MKTIKLDINDNLVEQTSTELIKNYLEEQLELLRLKALSQNIKEAIPERNFDLENEMKKAKEKAWDEYKNKYLSGIIE